MILGRISMDIQGTGQKRLKGSHGAPGQINRDCGVDLFRRSQSRALSIEQRSVL